MQNVWKVPRLSYTSKQLHGLAKKIVELTFSMGGSPGIYYEGIQCNYVFPNGRPCFDPKRGSYDDECPICQGRGHYYKEGIEIPIIVMDSPNPLKIDNKFGAIYEDNMRLAVPSYILPRVVKINNNGTVVVVPDKFSIRDINNEIWNIVYMQGEPKDVYLAGVLFHSIDVSTNAYIEQNNYEAPKLTLDVNLAPDKLGEAPKKQNIIDSINEDILGLRTQQSSRIVIDNSFISDLDKL